MIELVLADRCTGCAVCVEVCPTDVFEFDAVSRLPVVARQEECHTCFLCEAHCPADALFVGPLRTPHPVSREEVLALGVLGNFRRAVGFDRYEPGSYSYAEPEVRDEATEGSALAKRATGGPDAAIYAALAVAAQRGLVDVSRRKPIDREVIF